MKNKENLFSKNNNELQVEDIVDRKDYSDEAKSLILNTIYRIDSSYKDYSTVKANVKPKNSIINEIAEILEKDCKKILTIDPNKSDIKRKFIIDHTRKQIKVFPSEVYLLQSLYYVQIDEQFAEDNAYEKAISFVLNRGRAIGKAEIIRDFTGWSWNYTIDNDINKFYNMLYQSLVLMIGEDEVENSIRNKNIIKSLGFKISEIYGKENAKIVIKRLTESALLTYRIVSKKDKEVDVKRILDSLINFERAIINCFYKKIELYNLKKDLIKLVFEIRYFNYIPFVKDKHLKDVTKLEIELRELQKELVKKICENYVAEVFSKNHELNYKIIKYVFKCKMINISKMQIKFKYEDGNLQIIYYDEKEMERNITINLGEDEVNEITKKMNKKIKLFI